MISKITTRYAICAALYLAENGTERIVTAKEISEARKIPLNYLPRILSIMVKKKIIKSFHGGREKGYRLTRDIYSVFLFEIIDIFEKWSEKGRLLREKTYTCDCPAKYCWKPIEEIIFTPLKKFSLGDIIDRKACSPINS